MTPQPSQHPQQPCRITVDAFSAASADFAPSTRRAYAGRLRAVQAALGGGPLTDFALSRVPTVMAAQGQSPSTRSGAE